jgi:VanZ family protein
MATQNSSPFWGIGVKKFIPGIAWFFLILIAVCTPGRDLPKMGSWFTQIDVDKIIHVGLFAVLAFLFMYPFSTTALSKNQKWHYFIKIAIASSLWGLTSELIQRYFIPGRSFDLFDWAADSLGGLIALVFCKIKFLNRA